MDEALASYIFRQIVAGKNIQLDFSRDKILRQIVADNLRQNSAGKIFS